MGAADIRAVLRPGGVEPGYELAVSPAAGLTGDAGRSFDIVAPGHIPELAEVEGRFELESQAGDRTTPDASLPPRTPRPATNGSDGTFSIPVSTSYEWSAVESRIPAEGGL